MIGIALRGGSYALFPTLLLRWKAMPDSDHRGRLIEASLRRAASDPGVRRSNEGPAWHSEEDLFAPDSQWPIDEIATEIRSAVERYLSADLAVPVARRIDLVGWVNVLEPGGWNSPHNHPNCSLAGVVWLQGQGRLALLDPRRATHFHPPGIDSRDRLYFDPTPGDAVLFPASLYHWVEPNPGPTPRISVGFNVYIT